MKKKVYKSGMAAGGHAGIGDTTIFYLIFKVEIVYNNTVSFGGREDAEPIQSSLSAKVLFRPLAA